MSENGNVKMSDNDVATKDDVGTNEMEMDDQMEEEESRRTVKLTAKALANKVEKLQKDRHSCVKQMKVLTNEMKEQMKNFDNAKDVQCTMGKLMNVYEDAKAAHDSLIALIPKEELENQIVWFSRVTKHNTDFINDVKQWLVDVGVTMHESNVEKNVAAKPDTEAMSPPEEVPVMQQELLPPHSDAHQIFSHSHKSTSAEGDLQETVQPGDSVSNASRRTKGTKVSSATSLRLKVEAEMAALTVQKRMIQDRHDLEEQMEQLRRQNEQLRKKKEQLELDTSMAANVAKMKVLGSRRSGVSMKSQVTDGMMEYFVKGQQAAVSTPQPRPTQGQVPSQPSVARQVPTPTVTTTGGAVAPVHSPTANTTTEAAVGVSAPAVTASGGAVDPAVRPRTAAPMASHMSTRAPVEQGNILSVMEKQNEITALLIQQQCLSSMPKKEIQIFDGDPLQYHTFIKSFEHCIETKNSNHTDCLYYLEQYTQGQPRELVRSCLHMSDGGYRKAKSLLREHFGNEHKIATAYMESALSWPSIKPDDTKDLHAYALFLRGCCNAMQDMTYMRELDMPSNLLTIIKKLPYRLRDKWRSVVCDFQENHNRRATFKDIVVFLEKQVKIISDPIFGDIKDPPGSKDTRRSRSQPLPKSKGSNFATNVTPARKEGMKEKESQMTTKRCLFCEAEHALELCPQLEKRTHDEKYKFLKENGICFGCLCKGHISKYCKKRLRCSICSLKHPRMLHIHSRTKESNKDPAEVKENTKDTAITSVLTSGVTGAGEDNCKLAIVPVQVKARKGNTTVHTYAFLDPGSTASFCTLGLMAKLNLQGRRSNILLRTMGQKKVIETHIVSGLEVAGLDSSDYCSLPGVYTQRTMPVNKRNIPQQNDINQWPHLKNIHLPELDSEVELLIGSDVPKALEPIDVIRSVGDGPYAVKTMLGWTVNGPLDVKTDALEQSEISANRISVVKLDQLWEQQFKTDFPECNRDEQEHSREDQQFLDLVTTSAKLVDGHYCIGLPLRNKDRCMPDNRSVAEQRTLNLKKRFKRDTSFHAEYTKFVSDMISKGYAEKVPDDVLERSDGGKWYLPHHGVLHPQKKKLRVVFDCGATFRGVSLNSQLLQGPDLTSSLIGVLTRCRKEPVVIAADIEAMFHQVKVPTEDRDLLRFLWWPDGDYSQNMVEYRMTVHLFGATSSPSCANFSVRKCAEDNINQFSAQAVNTIMNNFYVDDCLASTATEEDAIALYHELRSICHKGGFLLTKWMSNSRQVLAAIPETERAKEVKNLDLDHDDLPVERVLGVQWCVQSDVFKFKILLKDRPLTRRGILSAVSSVYDPLGMLAPVVLTAKKILQDLCRKKIGWDDAIPDSIAQDWMTWIQDLHLLEDFQVDRCFKPTSFEKVTHAHLHHFADACEDGYGTATYLVLHDDQGQVHCGFVMGKARVAPLKPATIPRMELTAATMASRMDTLLRKELQMELADSVFWTDSTSVLKYINNKTARFRTFVANRVAAIVKVSHAHQWRYVNSVNNPADMASRGLTVKTFLKKAIWVSGPQFLLRPQEEWPQNPDCLEEISDKDSEVKSMTVNAAQITPDEVDATTRFITYFSSWTGLKKAAAWMLRLKGLLLERCRRKKQASTVTAELRKDNILKRDLRSAQKDTRNEETQKYGLTVEELATAEMAIIGFCQRKRFADEMSR